jgi:HK97 family phage prohead protease
MDRAYSLIEIRAVSDDKRTFTGWATTPATDRMGDVIDPMGAKFKNPVPLLHQHDSQRPIGLVKLKKATEAGIEFEAEIPVIEEPGQLKERVDLAWAEIKAGLVRAVSIGFRPLKDGYEVMKDGGWFFHAIEILELSAVTIPANHQAVITTIKSFDDAARAEREPLHTEIPAEPEDKATPGRKVHVARLEKTAPAGAKPFVINRVHPLR